MYTLGTIAANIIANTKPVNEVRLLNPSHFSPLLFLVGSRCGVVSGLAAQHNMVLDYACTGLGRFTTHRVSHALYINWYTMRIFVPIVLCLRSLFQTCFLRSSAHQDATRATTFVTGHGLVCAHCQGSLHWTDFEERNSTCLSLFCELSGNNNQTRTKQPSYGILNTSLM